MNRRQFLQIALMGSLVPFASELGRRAVSQRDTKGPPNVLLLVFDTLSANHMSIYGYPRRTTPNLERFAGRATVYHANYSSGNFTTPSTASLLTGSQPWTHRGINLGATIRDDLAENNLFRAFDSRVYDRLAYTHNPFVSYLLHQFRADLDHLKSTHDLALLYDQFSQPLGLPDHNAAYRSETRILRPTDWRLQPSSLFVSHLDEAIRAWRKSGLTARFAEQFPSGLPNHNGSQYFLLETAVDWLQRLVSDEGRPFVAYVHLWPPHHPYAPRREFIGKFEDGWIPVAKPAHHFSMMYHNSQLNRLRTEYDEYIAYVDAEFGRLYDHLLETGTIDNTIVVVTSDHGELFERGIFQHITPTLYDPIVHVPLLISEPGESKRVDVHSPSSSVDLLPTLLHMTGQPVPTWCVGRPLQPFGDSPDETPDRAVFALEAKQNPKMEPLRTGTASIIRGRYKLIEYFGYPEHSGSQELYDLKSDPDELTDLYAKSSSLARNLRSELKETIHSGDRVGAG